MQRHDAKTLCLLHLEKWECLGWAFTWMRGKNTLGKVSAKRSLIDGTLYNKKIHLSTYLVDLNSEDIVEDIILHEIAHIKAGFRANHGYKWQQWCREVGATPRATCGHPDLVLAPYRYHLWCDGCDRSMGGWHRRPKRVCDRQCIQCGRNSLGNLRLIEHLLQR